MDDMVEPGGASRPWRQHVAVEALGEDAAPAQDRIAARSPGRDHETDCPAPSQDCRLMLSGSRGPTPFQSQSSALIDRIGAAPNIPQKDDGCWGSLFSNTSYPDRNTVERMFYQMKEVCEITIG